MADDVQSEVYIPEVYTYKKIYGSDVTVLRSDGAYVPITSKEVVTYIASGYVIADADPISYEILRSVAYPPFLEYLDAQVKKASSDPEVSAAGTAQEAAYLAACLDVKAQFPKPATTE